MSIGAADIQKAFVATWNDSGLNATFQALGAGDVVLRDAEAEPGQDYPYCLMEQPTVDITSRMSATSGQRQIRDVMQTLHVLVSEVSGDGRTGKEIAAYLAEEVMKVFGGHPTETPETLTLDNGTFLITQYETDYGTRIGDQEYQWTISYAIKVDVPVMA